MTRSQTIERIKACIPELRQYGVKTIGLFGSVARDESGPESDVDVLVEFEGPATFDAYMDVKELLERILGRQVDLVTRAAVKPRLRSAIERDLLHVA